MKANMICAVLAFAAANTAEAASHCRVGPGDLKWPIRAATIDEFTTKPSRNYEISKAWGKPTHDIEIVHEDRFYLTKTSDDRIELKHKRKDHSGAYAELVGSGHLAIDSSSLWARGPAVTPGGTIVGEYMIFRIPDSGTSNTRKCKHVGRHQDDQCEAMHFEFFDDDDTQNFEHKPKLDKNVTKLTSPGDCKTPQAEAGDGDGDDGPD